MRLKIVLPLVLVLVGAAMIDAKACVCPAVYVVRVCGSNGKTYGSYCEAKCARVRVRYEGPCRRRGRRAVDLPN